MSMKEGTEGRKEKEEDKMEGDKMEGEKDGGRKNCALLCIGQQNT